MEFTESQRKLLLSTPSAIIYERKFDTALRDSFHRAFYWRYNNNRLTEDDRLLTLNTRVEVPITDCSLDSDHYACFLKLVLESSFEDKLTRQAGSVLNQANELANKSIAVQLGYILENNLTSHSERVRLLANVNIAQRPPPELLHKLHQVHQLLNDVVVESNNIHQKKPKNVSNEEWFKSQVKRNSKALEPYPVTFVWNQALVYIKIRDRHYLAPRPVILMFHNKISDLLSVLMLAWIEDGITNPMNSYDLTVRFVTELASLANTYKNKAYTIFKSLEAFGAGETLREAEEWTNVEYLLAAATDLEEKTGFNYMHSNLRSLLIEADIPFRHELMTLGKLLGHPYVDMEAGSRSLHKKTTEVYQLNMALVHKSICYIKENYIRNHIYKYGKWPPSCLNSTQTPKPLALAFIHNKDPNHPSIVDQYGQTKITDYDFVDILPSMKFSKLENVIPYLKDKTISVLKSKVVNRYLTLPQERHQGKDYDISWKDTRLLLTYLLHPSALHDPIPFLDEYTYAQDLKAFMNYLVIRVVPKEKELKEEYRGFGCKTYEDRHRTLAQEKNVMKFLDAYSDEQAMTLSELSLFQRLNAMRLLNKAYTQHKILYIVVDSSAWNNHFRAETVDIVMHETLDKIFDYPIFSKTHEAYKNTLFYVPDTDRNYHWEGQGGGIEGLNQDTWVTVYIAQIKVALEEFGFKAHILCKGDDLRIAIAIPKHIYEATSMQVYKNKIVTRIKEVLTQFGHKINVQESYGSSRYFAFSKYASLDMVELPQTFRKIQKTYGASNAFLPVLDEYIGATFSNAHSAASVSPTCLGPYKVALLWMYLYILAHDSYSGASVDELVALSLIPSLAGGFPIIYLHNMHVRAESDLLSPFLGLYMFCRTRHIYIALAMQKFMVIPYISVPDLEQLMRDPYALPSDRPTLPSVTLRQLVLPILEQTVQNSDVKELLELAKTDSSQLLINCLASCVPYHAKVVSNLYSATPKGILEELLRKFESARSINELIILKAGRGRTGQMLRRVIRSEMKLQKWRAMRLQGHPPPNLRPYYQLVQLCPSHSADKIRAMAWGKPIEGITMPPLQHQVYLCQVNDQVTNKWALHNHFQLTISEIQTSAARDGREQYGIGPESPFIGYSTRAGTTEPTIHFVEHDVILSKLKKLLDLASWTSVVEVLETGQELTSNCPEVINIILGLYTHETLSTLAPFTSQRKKGTMQHHLRAPNFRESIVPNCLRNIYTRFSGESNTHLTLRTSTEHYTVNFLHIFCYLCWQVFLELEVSQFSSTPKLLWGVTTACEHCTKPIHEHALVFDTRQVKTLKFTPLRVTNVGQLSDMILRESKLVLGEKGPPIQKILGGDDVEKASIGILQEYTFMSYFKAQQLQVRYGAHALTAQATHILSTLSATNTSRDVSLTELKYITVKTIVDYIRSQVYGQLLCTMKTDNPHALLVHVLTTPPEQLPWYGLMACLAKIGRLSEVLHQIAREVGSALHINFHDAGGASKYIAQVSALFVKDQPYIPQIVLITYYSQVQLEYLLRQHLLVVLRCYHRRTYDVYIPSRTPKDETEAHNVITLLYEWMTSYVCGEYLLRQVPLIISNYLASEHEGLLNVDLNDFVDVTYEELLDEKPKWPLERAKIQSACIKLGVDATVFKTCDDVILERVKANVEAYINTNHMEFCVMNLADCIRIVRTSGTFEIDDTSVDAQLATVQSFATEEWSLPVGNLRLPPIAMSIKAQDVVAQIETPPDTLFTLPSDVEYINPSYAYKLFGLGNGSEGYLLDILINLGVTRRSSHSITACCLADGLGGFSTCILNMFGPDTHVVFSTLPSPKGERIRPEAVISASKEYISRVIYEHVQEGYGDLKHPDTWTRLAAYQLKYSIITCDIQLQDSDYTLESNVFFDLIKYYISHRAPPYLLITRMSIVSTVLASHVVTMLAHYCEHIILYQPKSLSNKKYYYIIAYGYRTSLPVPEDLPRHAINESIHTRVLALHRRVYTTWKKIAGDIHFEISLNSLQNKQFAHYLIFQSNFYVQSLLHIRGGLVIPLVGDDMDLTIINIAKGYAEIYSQGPMNLFRQLLIDTVAECLNLLTAPLPKHVQQSQTWNPDYRGHRHYIVNRLCFTYGLLECINMWDGFDGHATYSTREMRSKYTLLMSQLPLRDQAGFDTDNHFHTPYYHEGLEITYWTSMIKGANTFLSLIGLASTYSTRYSRDVYKHT